MVRDKKTFRGEEQETIVGTAEAHVMMYISGDFNVGTSGIG